MKLGKWITRTRLAIILGILALAVLGAALALRRPALYRSHTSTSP